MIEIDAKCREILELYLPNLDELLHGDMKTFEIALGDLLLRSYDKNNSPTKLTRVIILVCDIIMGTNLAEFKVE